MPPYSIAGSDPVPQIPMGCPDLPVAVGMGVGGRWSVGETVSEMRWFVK